jgi:endonuclease-3
MSSNNKIARINNIFAVLQQHNPQPKIELNYHNHFTLLIAVLLSAQSTDVGVNKATTKLFAVADTPQKMLALQEDGLKAYISSIGLYNSKARNIMLLCQQLINLHNSQVPNNYNDLIKLAGIGSKSAKVILNCLFNQPTIAVDTHVFRVANRLGFVKTKTAKQTELQLPKIIPAKWQQHAHHWLVLHGRYICKAIKPNCQQCSINNFCPNNNFNKLCQPTT